MTTLSDLIPKLLLATESEKLKWTQSDADPDAFIAPFAGKELDISLFLDGVKPRYLLSLRDAALNEIARVVASDADETFAALGRLHAGARASAKGYFEVIQDFSRRLDELVA